MFLTNSQGISVNLQLCDQKNKYLISLVRVLTAKTLNTFILDTFVEHVMKNVMVFTVLQFSFRYTTMLLKELKENNRNGPRS